jgi:hypothetical protein
MAYCRFSTNDFQCDVYVYESNPGGWAIHIASRRVIYTEPLPDRIPFDATDVDAFVAKQFARDVAVDAIRERSEWESIKLPYAGTTIYEPSAGDAALRLIALRDMGYRVPDYAITELIEEQAELDGKPD